MAVNFLKSTPFILYSHFNLDLPIFNTIVSILLSLDTSPNNFLFPARESLPFLMAVLELWFTLLLQHSPESHKCHWQELCLRKEFEFVSLKVYTFQTAPASLELRSSSLTFIVKLEPGKLFVQLMLLNGLSFLISICCDFGFLSFQNCEKISGFPTAFYHQMLLLYESGSCLELV